MAPSKGTSRLFCQGWRLELPRSPASFSLISVQPKRNLSHHSKPRPSVESPPRPGIAEAIAQHAQLRRVAFVSSTSDENDPRELSYQQLLDDSRTIEEGLKACPFPDRNHGGPFRNEAAGAWALQATSTYRFATQLLGILDGHHVAVPVKPGLPQPELDYILQDSNAWPIDPQDLGIRSAHRSGGSRIWQAAQSIRSDPEHEPESRTGRGSRETAGQAATTSDISSGVMLYTSGTTSRPKGVLLTQKMLAAQCQSLIEAWHYAPTDHVLHVLPLNHIHGLMNGLLAPLYAGCSIEFLRHSDLSMAEAIWCRLAARFIRHDQRAYIDTNHIEHVRKDSVASDTGDPARVRPSCASKTFRGRAISVFTAVPTIYKNMLEAFPRLDPTTQDAAKEAIKPENLRLPMSGSAPLPRNIQAQWAELSQGSMILERYGMTETGMILSCGLEASSKIVGSVGWPLPSVSVRLVSGGGDGEIIEQAEHDTPDTGRREGEIQVHGNGIFAGYHGDHKRENDWKVDPDGVRWFRTGDIAYRDPSLIRLNGSTNADSAEPWIKGSPYIILGRLSMDIIKSGGEKISALEVETAIYSVLEDISEVAVLGVPSERWGQRLAAVIVMKRSKTDSEREAGQIRKVRALEITRQLSSVLSKEKIPRLWKSVPAIPRNAMGKVNKSELGRLLWPGRYAGADAPLD